MSFLEKASKPKATPPIITIVGSPGAGKTSFAGTFPNPIFIQAETVSAVFEGWDDDVQPTLLPEIPKAVADAAGNITVSPKQHVMDQLRELASADHGFKTLVVDSVTAFNAKLESEIALRDGVGTIADASGGYFKGYTEVAQWHADFMYACQVLAKRKGMAIVLLAHTGIEKIKNSPDEASEYSVYSLDMYKKSASIYINNSDVVLYIKKEEFITGAETNKKGQTTKYGRVMQTGDRKIITTGDGLTGYVAAKSRYAMPAEIELPLGSNPLLQYIKHFQAEK